ncbi:MAG: hypothetical protein ACE367_12805 [Acidimicrobiales bacterium]
MSVTTGAVRVLLDLRERWSERGVDWWSEDPTSLDGDGWVRTDLLAADPERIASLVDAWADVHEITDRKAAASLLVKRLGSIVAFPPTVAWMSWRRVPTIRPDALWLRFDGGVPDRLAIPVPEAAVLAGDALAGAPGVTVLEDLELLAHLESTAYRATMGTLIDGFHAAERTGRRHLWGNLALTAVNSALWCAHRDDPWSDGRALLAADDQLGRTLEVLPAERPDTGPFLVALRRTCCMAYADEDHGLCASCSLLDRDARIDDLTERIGNAWRDRTG